MARVEKTVFISYRRKDIAWALAVYQYLTSQKYDVFFDYTSLSGGDFEQVIVSNIKARAHFVLILTPTALDRCNEPGDWLRREIETAVDEKRNIIPLFFDGFNFSSISVTERLTGRLDAVKRYNGLDVPAGYFLEAMERLRNRYLNIPLDAVIHPVPTEIRRVVKEEQIAANKALESKKEDIEELVKPSKQKRAASRSPIVRGAMEEVKIPNLRHYGIGAGIVLVAVLGIYGINSLIQNVEGGEATMPADTPTRVLMETDTPISSDTPTQALMETDTPAQPPPPSSTTLLETSFEDLNIANSSVITPFLFTRDSPGIVLWSYSIHPESTNWEIDNRSRTGNLAINVIPHGNPDTDLANTATTIISGAFLDVIFDVSGYDVVSVKFWVNTISNPRIASIHNCDSALEVYFKTNSEDWTHKSALCGENKAESSGWRLMSLNFDVTGKSTIQFAFEYTLQNNPMSDPTVYYLIDDLSVTAE